MTADAFAKPEHPTGLVCRQCGGRRFRVVSTDKKNGMICRSRQCQHCGKNHRTTERINPETAAS